MTMTKLYAFHFSFGPDGGKLAGALYGKTNGNHSVIDLKKLCTYQRPSRGVARGVDPGEPPGICTKTFANSTYPRPIFFHKKLPLSLPRGA